MRASEIAIESADLINELDKLTEGYLETPFIPDPEDSNLVTSNKAVLHKLMAKYIVANSITASWNKKKQEIRDQIEETCLLTGIDPEPVAGELKIIHSDNDFQIVKKQNKNGTSLSAQDLIIELQKAGVTKDQIDKATEAATKEKKGAVYFYVNGVE
jgi:hypothetical protein